MFINELILFPKSYAYKARIISNYEDDWFYFPGNEGRIKNMIQCTQCKVLVHKSCRGVLKIQNVYYCRSCDL